MSAFKLIFQKWQSYLIRYRKNRLHSLYLKKSFSKIPSYFKKEKDYTKLTFDSFPFLFLMIDQGNLEGVKIFMDGLSSNMKDFIIHDQSNPLKVNALVYAYLEGQYQIGDLFEQRGFKLGSLNSDLQNLLHISAIYRRNEAFNKAIQKNLEINAIDTFGNTPLHYSCRVGYPDMIKALLAGKAKKLQNKINQYPIHMAIESGTMEAVDLLKDLWGKYGNFHPIHSAARSGMIQVLKILLSKDPVLINCRDHKGMTPLHHAVSVQNFDTVTFLLNQRQLLIDRQDIYGNTSLHIAFLTSNIDIAIKLVQRGFELDILNQDHLAPVDLGIDTQNPQILKYLKTMKSKSKRLDDWHSSSNFSA